MATNDSITDSTIESTAQSGGDTPKDRDAKRAMVFQSITETMDADPDAKVEMIYIRALQLHMGRLHPSPSARAERIIQMQREIDGLALLLLRASSEMMPVPTEAGDPQGGVEDQSATL